MKEKIPSNVLAYFKLQRYALTTKIIQTLQVETFVNTNIALNLHSYKN